MNYCRLTKAEYEAAGKPANLVELCKKLNKPQTFVPAYHFDANKNAKEVVKFTATGVSVDPLWKNAASDPRRSDRGGLAGHGAAPERTGYPRSRHTKKPSSSTVTFVKPWSCKSSCTTPDSACGHPQ